MLHVYLNYMYVNFMASDVHVDIHHHKHILYYPVGNGPQKLVWGVCHGARGSGDMQRVRMVV